MHYVCFVNKDYLLLNNMLNQNQRYYRQFSVCMLFMIATLSLLCGCMQTNPGTATALNLTASRKTITFAPPDSVLLLSQRLNNLRSQDGKTVSSELLRQADSLYSAMKIIPFRFQQLEDSTYLDPSFFSKNKKLAQQALSDSP